ncbi:hypothetical protein B0H19DRAFT_1085621 [Mycena capillaripes]|nr:hypothetical protein B0H19DRAFT_1085621 [Mycena capillaripes]
MITAAIFVITHAPLARATLAVPHAACARGGSTSPESGHGHGFARGGSLSLELVYARGADDGGRARCRAALYLSLSLARPQACRSRPAGESMSPAEETYFAQAYSAAEMRTFRCEQYTLGFVVRAEAEWVDLRRRVKELLRTIFAIADEPPTWPGADDDDMDLESISDQEEKEVGIGSSSGRSEEVDVALYLGRPSASVALPPPSKNKGKDTVGDAYAELEGDDGFVDASGEVEIEDDWIDPVTPPVAKKGSKGKGKSKSKKAVPVSSVHYPFPVSAEDGRGLGTPGSLREREGEREREWMVTVSLRAAG